MGCHPPFWNIRKWQKHWQLVGIHQIWPHEQILAFFCREGAFARIQRKGNFAVLKANSTDKEADRAIRTTLRRIRQRNTINSHTSTISRTISIRWQSHSQTRTSTSPIAVDPEQPGGTPQSLILPPAQKQRGDRSIEGNNRFIKDRKTSVFWTLIILALSLNITRWNR